MRFSRKKLQFKLFLSDLLIFVTALFLTLTIRKKEIPEISYYLLHLKHFSIVIISWIACLYTTGFYSLDVPFSSERLPVKLLASCIISTLTGFGYFYLIPSLRIFPKTVLILFNLTVSIMIFAWRLIFDFYFLTQKKHYNYIFVGYNATIKDLISKSAEKNYVDFVPAAIFEPDSSILSENDSSLPVLKTTKELEEFAKKNQIKIFILQAEREYDKETTRFLFSEFENKAVFYNVPEFYELITRKIPLGAINENWFLNKINHKRFIYYAAKRFFDIVIASALFLLTAVLWPVFALIIKCESKGPVFFTQIRDGRKGKPFKLIKFRTMRTENNSFSPTTEQDSRITKFGNFLRKSRLDELPQILNVIRGDMSLIGPRPERPELSCELEKVIPYYRQRLIIKPGITGWDQVAGEYHSPSVEDTYKKLQLDLYYIKNQSVWLDISIFFKTIMTVFMREGR